MFSEQQIRDYLGRERAEILLKRADADALATPRTLKAVLEIPDDQLPSVRTASDIYWRGLNATIEAMFKDQKQALSDELGHLLIKREGAIEILSLLAFRMAQQGYLAGVTGAEAPGFLTDVWMDRPKGWQTRFGETFDRFHQRIVALARLNEYLEFAVIKNNELSRLEFSNRTMMDFFAALWLTRYAEEDDRQWLSRNVHIHDESGADHLRELWKLAAEMPGKQFEGLDAARNDLAYARAMAALCGARNEQEEPLRSTQMIWRSWPAMLRLAGFLQKTEADWTEADVGAATAVAQDTAWKMVEQGAPLPRFESKTARIAGRAVLEFLSEFPRMLHGESGPEAERIARDFQNWFVPIPQPPQTDLRFLMGDAPSCYESQVEAPFRMAKYTVTREIYELFDQRHPARHANEDVVSDLFSYRTTAPLPRCPAIYVDWYDAWVVAAWLGCRLPTEYEWEYACRANPGIEQIAGKRPTKWHCGDDEQKLQAYAWFDQAWRTDRTHTVDGSRGEAKLPNGWGLFHMHGNVQEWTSSWYQRDAQEGRELLYGSSRVLRGGGFNNYADYCRSAYRDFHSPAQADACTGFRVVATEYPRGE